MSRRRRESWKIASGRAADHVPALKAHRQIIQAAVPRESTELVQEQAPAETSPSRWMPETHQILLVGGVAGAIVLLLVYL